MRFFLIRIVFFTVVFLLLLLGLSWIVPQWTHNTINTLTSRRPGSVEEDSERSDTLHVTDLLEDTIDDVIDDVSEPSQNDVSEPSQDDTLSQAPVDMSESKTITVDKPSNYDDVDGVSVIDDILGIDDAMSDEPTLQATEKVDVVESVDSFKEVQSVEQTLQLTPEEVTLLDALQKHTH